MTPRFQASDRFAPVDQAHGLRWLFAGRGCSSCRWSHNLHVACTAWRWNACARPHPARQRAHRWSSTRPTARRRPMNWRRSTSPTAWSSSRRRCLSRRARAAAAPRRRPRLDGIVPGPRWTPRRTPRSCSCTPARATWRGCSPADDRRPGAAAAARRRPPGQRHPCLRGDEVFCDARAARASPVLGRRRRRAAHRRAAGAMRRDFLGAVLHRLDARRSGRPRRRRPSRDCRLPGPRCSGSAETTRGARRRRALPAGRYIRAMASN